jgi:glycine/D-amino acid oxidase-like deaminating enzyme/nitrite reductase/ring-hydroxylating ferredoxin subunit
MTERDGVLPSLWQTTTNAYKSSGAAATDRFDVVIAGAGITGVTLALLLQKAGKQCLILEAQTVGFGTTGGSTAHLNTLLDIPYTTLIKNFGKEKASHVANATKSAIELVRKHVAEYNIDCGFEEQAGYLFSQNDTQTRELKDIFKACQTVSVETSYADKIPIDIPLQKAIRVEGQAKIHPLRYVNALVKEFVQLGGTIVEHCRVIEAHKGDEKDSVSIETSTGTFHASFMVFATHIPTGVNLLHLRCAPYRSYAMAVKLTNDRYPDGLVYDMYDPYHYYRTHVIDGEKFLIVGGEDHRTGDESNTNGCFLKLESHIRSNFDVREITNRWSSQYFEPADGLPYIGHLPGNPENVLVATGYGGNGITYSHVAAQLLKSIVLNEKSPYESLFTPGRVKPVAGFTEFVRHNLEVVNALVGGWLGKDQLPELSDLGVGEAKVVKYEKESIALYKDENHVLHALDPACTHLKCSVNWNAAEKSWDCPCHGTRYSYEGKVITGPATKDLEPIEIRQTVEEKER